MFQKPKHCDVGSSCMWLGTKMLFPFQRWRVDSELGYNRANRRSIKKGFNTNFCVRNRHLFSSSRRVLHQLQNV